MTTVLSTNQLLLGTGLVLSSPWGLSSWPGRCGCRRSWFCCRSGLTLRAAHAELPIGAAVELQDILVAVAPGAQRQLDSVPLRRLAERLAQRRRLPGKQTVGALQDHRLAAQAAHDLRALDAGWAATKHEHATRDRVSARRLARAPDALELTKPCDRRHERVGAGGHHDVLGGVADAVDFDDAGPGEPARTSQQVDTPVRQPALLPGVGVIGHHEAPPRSARRQHRPRPFSSLASSGASPGRSRDFDGIHAQ